MTVDLAAVVRNYGLVCAHVKNARVGAVVKADAYGLGAPVIAPVLAKAGCRQFYVATTDEGAALVPHLTQSAGHRIFVLGGASDDPALTSVINTLGDVEALRERARRTGTAQRAALHVDTGMNRLGLSAGDFAGLIDDPQGLEGIAPELIMSHLACADTPGMPQNALQLSRFEALRARLPATPASLANSAGVLLGQPYHFDVVRPGIALYGGNPLGTDANLFHPTVTVEAPLLQVRFIDKGDSVGYAATYRAGGTARIATIAAGYADGILRAASNRGSVVIGGHVAEIVGRVSMDLITVDVTAVPADVAVPGAMAQLIGPQRSLDAVARDARTISYEVLTRLGGRLERRYAAGNETSAEGRGA